MNSKIEFIGTVNGLKAYVHKNSFSIYTMCSMYPFWRCGYVEFPNSMGSSEVGLYISRILNNSNVHGGITYCKEIDGVMILGFDCNHYIDTRKYINKPRSLGYCMDNLRLLSTEVLKAKKYYRKFLIKQKIKELKRRKNVNGIHIRGL